MRKLNGLMVAMSAAFLATPAAAAGEVVADVGQVAEVMKRGGYSVEVKKTKDGEYIRATRTKDSYAISVLFNDCAEGTMRDCKSVQFYSGFSPKTKPSLEALNQYASDHRWGRVYRDKDGDPVIEMDVDLEKGGMSEALFLDNLEYFETVVDQFGKFVFEGKTGG